MRILDSIEAMEAAVRQANCAPTEAERVAALCGLSLSPVREGLDVLDPFSPDYRAAVLRLYHRISGRAEYTPQINELAPYLDEAPSLPNYYRGGTTAYAGEMLGAMASVLKTIDLRPGQRMLEYGAGEGGISLEAAKCGVDVVVVDIEPRYLGIIRERAGAAGVAVTTVCGEFGHDPGGQFDVVLFFEAFHHCLDHFALACTLRKLLAPGGRLILAGEPVIGPHNENWRCAVPYPWGLRMDGLSFRAIQTYGWMELGFDHGYLLAMLQRAGYVVAFHRSPATDRANCYVATAT